MKTVFLEITTRCNIRCVKCPNRYFFGAGEDIDENILNFILFKILNEFQGKVLIATGEPTLRRDYLELVRKWSKKDRQRRVMIFTNGTLIQTLSEQLLGDDQLIFAVSLDGVTEETVRILQKGVNIQSVCSNLIELRREGILKNLVMNFTLHKLLTKELENIFRFVKDLKINKLYFTPLLNFDFPNKGLVKELQFSETEFELIKEKIKIMEEKWGIKAIISSNSTCRGPRPIFRTDGYVSYCEGTDGIYSFRIKENILEILSKFKLDKSICKECLKKGDSFFRRLPKRLTTKVFTQK
jgi:MoaA/NifB/PqqE/SkfB family radical SAM enzyme